jgi:heterodisulfide reductase subunit A
LTRPQAGADESHGVKFVICPLLATFGCSLSRKVIPIANVLIVGGGLSGCTAALEIANGGHKAVIVEKSAEIGGKVRHYGCKAASACNNCGLCLPGDLWEAVENHPGINILTCSVLVDLAGSRGEFTAVVKKRGDGVHKVLTGISRVIVSVGFERASASSSAHLEFSGSQNIISGYQLERYISGRGRNDLLPDFPASVAFIQCFGSRDVQEAALYCSRVCCGYSTRSARVLKHYYPDIRISFFYMDLQYVEGDSYYETLVSEGFEFIRSRPVKIKAGKPASVVCEDPCTGEIVEREFDLVVLSEGIHPAADTDRIAEICMLGVNGDGFLKQARNASETGIYVAGCAAGPARIEEVYNESLAVAGQVLNDIKRDTGTAPVKY